MEFSIDEINGIPDVAMRMELLLSGLERLRPDGSAVLQAMARDESPLFLGVAYRWCQNNQELDTAGAGFLARMAVEEDAISRMLSTPAEMTETESSLLIRCLARFSPGSERALIDKYAEQITPDWAPIGLFRVLDEMRELDGSGTTRTILVRLLRSQNAQVRSKAAEALVWMTRSTDTAISLLSDADSRVRANAIEGLWRHADSRAAQQVFEQYARDPVPRISVNALIGLYRAGEPQAVERLIERAQQPNRPMQQAAIWAMGFLLDPVFEEPLREQLKTGEPALRGHLLRALVRLNRARNGGSGEVRPPSGPHSPLGEILISGAPAWNQWRATSRETQPSLDNECFAGQDLTGADLSFCRLWGADFRKAKLDLASLFGADVRDADFTGARLNRADLRAMETSANTRFGEVEIRGAAIYGTTLATGT